MSGPLLIELSKDRQALVCRTFSNIDVQMRMIVNEEASKCTAYGKIQNLRRDIDDWNKYILKDIKEVLSNVFPSIVSTSRDARIAKLYEIIYILNFEFRKVCRKGGDYKQMMKVGILLLDVVTESRRKEPTWESNLNSKEQEFLKNIDRLINDVGTLDICLAKTDEEAMNSIDHIIMYLRLKLEEADCSADTAHKNSYVGDLRAEISLKLNVWLDYRERKIFQQFNKFQLFK